MITPSIPEPRGLADPRWAKAMRRAAVLVATGSLLTGCLGQSDPGQSDPGRSDPGSAESPHPPPNSPISPDADSDPFAQAELAGVRVRLVIPAAGVDETLALAGEDVLAPDGAGFRLATCGPLNAPAGFVGGYAVAIVDTATTGSVARFEVMPVGEVTGGGTYPAIGSLQASSGESFALEGELTVDGTLRSGNFTLTDPAGNPVTGTYECLIR